MHKAYLSILLLFVSLVINSLVSSTYIPLHEGLKRRKVRTKKQKARAKRRAKKRALAREKQLGLRKPRRSATETVATVSNIIKDPIPPTNQVELIKSFIMQQ